MQDTSDAEVAGPTHGALGLSTVRGFDDVNRQSIEICASNMNEEVAECRWNALPIATMPPFDFKITSPSTSVLSCAQLGSCKIGRSRVTSIAA